MEDWVYVERRRRSRKKNPEGKNKYGGRHSGHRDHAIDGTNLNNDPFTEYIPMDQEKHAEKTFSEMKKVMNGLEKSEFFANFHQQFMEVVDKANVNIKYAICLGLGSLADPNWNNRKACLYQLGFVLLLRRIYKVQKVYIYDPKSGDVDRNICGRFDIEVLSPCEEQHNVDEELQRNRCPQGEEDDSTSHIIEKTSAHERTLVFMPHCDVSLYSQVMHSIYMNEKLNYAKAHFFLTLEKTIFLGNSFEYYREHIYMYRPFGIPAYAIHMLRNRGTVVETPGERSINRLVEFYKIDHFLFYVHKYARERKFPVFADHASAFNDMAIITFGSMPDRLNFWLNVWEDVSSGGPR
ncbi:conserved Plasmodium protein, unknown function [Plasmodium knowlesi strain H]|uniref:SRR1-like domain-containing protein n=3 Tax=Plasmodium knowlesi TaxID=5850 RepID=A0A5K1TVI9_PLAKH|nr:SRR1-like protein [Plasmodium knowlesi strain H]OTN66754.1 Uncharacterized protein PKNOH_S08500600 [Plasmodium knowlesi]CAA9986725.1 SRR1-like protein [Plasmodium knowlesi strain H]SBO23544.1 conserved Plasmodium protein, unknown function [Plasmodium knowlesi strain H]SBO25062.1 conserved Plasmodium protein, unknown function [Plasmodium knowlesi strain H]VVS76199.1 SRR1-like protein [Plasmodium knowlesi strain H]|eukprot:XP_002257910.1 hypothetical protein, conserved in Plasmodium species [Plasmodium knowlesi strain H]